MTIVDVVALAAVLVALYGLWRLGRRTRSRSRPSRQPVLPFHWPPAWWWWWWFR